MRHLLQRSKGWQCSRDNVCRVVECSEETQSSMEAGTYMSGRTTSRLTFKVDLDAGGIGSRYRLTVTA